MKNFSKTLKSEDYYIKNGWLGLHENRIEIPLAFRYIDWCNEDIIEVGAVVCHRGYTEKYLVIDPFHDYTKKVSSEYGLVIDAEEYDFTDKNILSISTIEHMGMLQYGNEEHDFKKPQRFLEKLRNEAKTFLVSIPVNANGVLTEYLKHNLEFMDWFGYIRDFKDCLRWNYVNGVDANISRMMLCKWNKKDGGKNGKGSTTGVIFITKGL